MNTIFMLNSMVDIMNEKGYTLVELIVTLAMVSMILLLLLSTFQFLMGVNEKIKYTEGSGRNVRDLHLFFQKQILKSEKIYEKKGVVYLQDMESEKYQYYNYYYLDKTSEILNRYKVNEIHLSSIGLGGKSQIADRIESFNMSAEGNNILITIKIKDQKKELKIIVFYPNEVIHVE